MGAETVKQRTKIMEKYCTVRVPDHTDFINCGRRAYVNGLCSYHFDKKRVELLSKRKGLEKELLKIEEEIKELKPKLTEKEFVNFYYSCLHDEVELATYVIDKVKRDTELYDLACKFLNARDGFMNFMDDLDSESYEED